VLFTITAVTGGAEASQVAVLDLATNKYKAVVPGASHARYVSSGHLLYEAGGALHAVRFDLDRLERQGAPVTVLDRLAPGAGQFAVGDDGTLVYADGSAPSAGTLVWADRQGNEEPLGAPPREYFQPRVSPDGMNVAAVIAESGVWIWNLQHRTLNKLTFDPANGFFPAWGRDSRRVFFSTGTPPFGIFSQIPGGAADTVASGTLGGMLTSDVTRDGKRVIFSQAGRDVMTAALDGSHRVDPLVQTPANERNGVVSPDGRWLAYESDDPSGRFEIYVRPFPQVDAGQWLISSDGGTRPLWMPDGHELIYVAPGGALMAVPVSPRAGKWNAGHPRKVLEGAYETVTRASGRTYDVSTDGRRFLVVKPPANQPKAQIVVVQNFFEELKRLVPAK